MDELSEGSKFCMWCGDSVPSARWALGYQTCLLCGEEHARQARMSWCVIQEYNKGAYQFVTQEAAPTTLKQTNQKNLRG